MIPRIPPRDLNLLAIVALVLLTAAGCAVTSFTETLTYAPATPSTRPTTNPTTAPSTRPVLLSVERQFDSARFLGDTGIEEAEAVTPEGGRITIKGFKTETSKALDVAKLALEKKP